MNWLAKTIGSSIRKKLMMAVTGLGFCGFLVAHLAGNITLFGGGGAFNAYAERLHSLGALLSIAELGLLLFAVVHIITGMFLFYENWRARPVGYLVKKNAGGQTIGASTMPYTGLLLLTFVITHLFNFSFVDKTDTTIFEIVSNTFSNALYVLLYIAGVIIAAVHISHGFWSAFQTMGANHPKYMVFIKTFGIVLSILVGVGFGSLPVYVSLIY